MYSMSIYNNNMNNQINIIVQNQAFLLNRELLINQSENKQIKMSKDFTLPFPQWVTKQTYLLIQKYLRTKDVGFLYPYVNQNQILVKVLRISDYLSLVKFQDKFINQILIPNINNLNCLTLLEESHKKLKNINDSQTWYNLLNMSIIYLSTHAFQMYKANSARFKKLNQKIVNQVLERVIRLQKKNSFPNKHALYRLIVECKQSQIGDPSKMFQMLRNNLKAKKIVSKIHAKLSWKLENVPELTEKNTKNFKYLEMTWFLKAHKTQQGLLVTLNLLPFQQNPTNPPNPPNFRSSQSQMSQNSQKSGKSFQVSNKSNQQRSQTQQIYRNDGFTKIGVFYSKVTWKHHEQSLQQDLKIHYIIMNENSTMQIILIDDKMQKKIGSDRIQLTIYCNIETIYTFLISYVFWHFDSLKFKGSNLCEQQLYALIKASKRVGNYSQALRITAELFNAYPKEVGNLEVAQGYDFSKMTKIELQIYSTIFGKKVYHQPNFTKVKTIDIQAANQIQNNRSSQGFNQGFSQGQKRTISPIPITPINSINKRHNFSTNSQLTINQGTNSLTNTPGPSNNMKQKMGSFNRSSSGRQQNIFNLPNESLANSRGDSRGGSKRKIFSRGSSQQDKKQDLIQQMLQVTDLSAYLNPEASRHPQFQKMLMVLKM